MVEVWKNIPDYPGYEVSNFGRVRTHNKITYKQGVKRCWKDRVLKPRKSSNKYGRNDYRVELWNNGKHKSFLVARLVAFTFFEVDISNSETTVNHIDGNSLNNNLSNLELVSRKENIQHAYRTGLYKNVTKKVKITDKITGTIIFPSSLSEGSKLMYKNQGYLSSKIINNIFEDEKYKWELI